MSVVDLFLKIKVAIKQEAEEKAAVNFNTEIIFQVDLDFSRRQDAQLVGSSEEESVSQSRSPGEKVELCQCSHFW